MTHTTGAPDPCLDRALDLKMFTLGKKEGNIVLACCGLFEVENVLHPDNDTYTVDLVQTKAPGDDLVDVVFGGCVCLLVPGRNRVRTRYKFACAFIAAAQTRCLGFVVLL